MSKERRQEDLDAEMLDLKKLRSPFPPEQIGKLPKGGTFLDYVGHADITARLLDVDPYWTWEPFAVTAEGLPALDKAGNLWIRLTVCGVTRIGVGDGPSMKVLVGDALRNAAMRFGVALDLWAKGDRQYAQEEAGQAAVRPQHVSAALQAIGALSADDKAALREWADQERLGAPETWTVEQAEVLQARAKQLAAR